MNFSGFFLTPSNAVLTSIILFILLIIAYIPTAKKEYPEQEYWGILGFLFTYGSKIGVIVLMIAVAMQLPPMAAIIAAIAVSIFASFIKLIVSHSDEAEKLSHSYWQYRLHQSILLGLFLGLWYAQVW